MTSSGECIITDYFILDHSHNCQDENPCKDATSRDFKQYYAHNEAAKYVQCSGHGNQCWEMPCPPGMMWDPKNIHCVRRIPNSEIY